MPTVAAKRRMDNPSEATHINGMDSDVLITGGGLNGLTLALALARAGISSTVIDRTPPDDHKARDFDGRSYALALTSMRMLGALGLGDLQQQPILEIKVSDGRAGQGASPLFLHFDHAEIEEGPMGYMVEDRHLRPALLGAVAAEPLITHLTGANVARQSTDTGCAQVVLATGEALKGHLIIGADGKFSGTAQRAGIKRMGWDYGQTALVCAIAHEKPHNGIAHQFFMPEGPLAILPLTGNRSSIVWTESTANAAALNGADSEAYLTALRPRFGNFLGEIGLEGSRHSYPLALSLANSFIAERVALVGDAAHGVHPIAGQGLNAGLKDCAALAEVLADAKRRGQDLASAVALGEYQRWRRFDTATLAMATDGFNRLFSNDNGLLRTVRDLGMGAVNAWPGLRRRFIREAAGLTGDIPRLMQGRAL